MGCDIHMHIEVKYRGEWHHLSHPRIERSYEFFAHMARCGRCKEIDPVAENRGIPEDMSLVTRIDYEHGVDSGIHDPSWLGRDEIEMLRTRWEQWQKRSGRYDYLKDDLEWGRFRTYLQGNAI